MTRPMLIAGLSLSLLTGMFGFSFAQKTVQQSDATQSKAQEKPKPSVDPKQMEAAIRALIVACDDSDPKVQIAAMQVLAERKALPSLIASKLKEHFFDEDESVAQAAKWTILRTEWDDIVLPCTDCVCKRPATPST